MATSPSVPWRPSSSSEIDQDVYALQQLDLQIEVLEEQLCSAREKRNELQRRVNLLRASQAPIRKVPREVLDMIFEKNPKDQEKRNAALMLVCKLWREIVLDSPRLWNTIVLELETIELVCPKWRYTVTCLERSVNSPLHIHIDIGTFALPPLPITPVADLFEEITRDYPANENIDDLLFDTNIHDYPDNDILTAIFYMTVTILRGRKDQLISRWSSLHVDVKGARLGRHPYELWDHITGVTDHLVDLHFVGTSPLRFVGQPERWRSVGFPNLMALEYLTTDVPSEFLNEVALPTTLKQLSLLTWMNMDHLSTINIARFSALTMLEVQIIRSGTQNPSEPRATLEFPFLQMLALSGDAHDAALAYFNAPKLTHLSVVCYSHIRYQEAPALSVVTDLLWDGSNIDDRKVLRSLVASSHRLKNFHAWRRSSLSLPMAQELMTAFNAEGITSAVCRADSTGWPYQFVPKIYDSTCAFVIH